MVWRGERETERERNRESIFLRAATLGNGGAGSTFSMAAVRVCTGFSGGIYSVLSSPDIQVAR